MCSAQALLSALGQHAPDILQACQQSMASATQDGSFVRPQPQAFEACRLESIDYAVMEHHANVAVLPFASAWSDVGSWNAVADLTSATPKATAFTAKALRCTPTTPSCTRRIARWWSLAHKTY